LRRGDANRLRLRLRLSTAAAAAYTVGRMNDVTRLLSAIAESTADAGWGYA
jgi:hypothetical protein